MILAGSLVHGQSTDAEEIKGDSLDTLEAIGISDYKTGDVVNEENTLRTATIDRETLSRYPAALGNLLAKETGIQSRQSGGFGSYSSVSIRAASAAQTGVYLDGVLLNSGGNPVIDLSTLEILNLGQVDIYRGGTPAQFGHGAIGGAVNLVTLQADSEPDSRVRFELGSFSQKGVQLSHQSNHDAWNFVFALSRRQSENDFRYLNNNGTPLNPQDDEYQRRENSQAQRTSALLRMGHQHRTDSRTDITLQVSARELGVPEWRNVADNDSTYDTVSGQFQLSHIIDNIGGWNSRLTTYIHNDKNHFKDPRSQIGLGAQDTLNRIQTLGAKSFWEYSLDSGTVGLSLDYRRESVISDERLDDSADYDADRDNWLATAQYTWFDSTDSWILTPSVSWQQSLFSASRRVGTVQQDNQSNETELGAQLGIAYQASDSLSLSANAGSYYRSPSFGELYGSIGLISGNPTLFPEEGINADIGIDYVREKFQLSASVFASFRDELIVTSFDSRGVGRPLNSGEARVYGVEFGALWQLTPKISLTGNLTLQKPESLDRTSGFYKKLLPGEAQLAWFTRLEYAQADWTAWYELDIQSDKFYDRANILPAADTAVQSVGMTWQKLPWQVSFAAQNLSDKNIEDFNGFPKPGRTLSLTATHNF